MCKLFINKLICLLRGHKYEKQFLAPYEKKYFLYNQCKRCGKILKDVP